MINYFLFLCKAEGECRQRFSLSFFLLKMLISNAINQLGYASMRVNSHKSYDYLLRVQKPEKESNILKLLPKVLSVASMIFGAMALAVGVFFITTACLTATVSPGTLVLIPFGVICLAGSYELIHLSING